jgi:hypothetical protein
LIIIIILYIKKIKSELSNPNDNVFVAITAPPGPSYPGIIGQLQVNVPENTASSGCKCLCDIVEDESKGIKKCFPGDKEIVDRFE